MELDGLFGYETIATRLIRKFGQENMLSAYAKRKDNFPAPGQVTSSIEEAKNFANNFEIQGIEIVANSKGIVDFSVGHPSSTLSLSKTFESIAVKDVGQHKTMIISTGKDASNDTLSKSLNSLWNCSAAIKKDGLAILLSESKFGIGSDAIQQYIEERLTIDSLKNPSKYVDGMEHLLCLTEIQKIFQIGLVSILPEFYAKKLNMISLNGVKLAMDYILKTQGARQKVAVVSDGARVLLR
jgi:nickel-dependent lactate racemase